MGGYDQRDVVELLLEQHQEFRRCFERMRTAAGEPKRQLFDNVVRLLAVHECAEEIVVHPVARQLLGSGSAVVDRRLAEQEAVEEALADLDDLGTGNPRFDARFAAFARLALRHAANEEREEFPVLRDRLSPGELRELAGGVRAVENAAPRSRDRAAGGGTTGPTSALFARIREEALAANGRQGGEKGGAE